MDHTLKPNELKYLLDNHDELVILDVRRKQDYEADPCLIPGAEWHDPEELEQWGTEIPAGSRAVVYCLKGGALSKMVTEFLQDRDVETCYLEGGINAWKTTVLGQSLDPSATCGASCGVTK
ncbi:rhodanese-like domain-containing protein [Candidatus Electronema sp. PJ]|uniref:rhodanese-like domain-containing protein n=1 Tax=Candidatus Electronema sp. PJ TaxID=3401572 RepID=UPI003AA803BD